MLARLLSCLALGLGRAVSASGQVLSVWVHSGPGPERDAYVASVRAFNDAQAVARDSVRAELIPLPEADYNEAVNKAARERRLPCVLGFDGPNVASYAAAGHLVALERFERLAQIPNAMLASLVRPASASYPVISRSFAQAVSQVARGADPQRALDQAAMAIDKYIDAEIAKAPR